jgi:hypothetical protein
MKLRVISTRSRTIHEYFTDAFRRAADRKPPAGAVPVSNHEGLRASFHLDRRDGRIDRVQYHCSTCVTLLGLCEHLSHVVLGMEPSAARSLTPEDLLQWHPEIPPERRDRAGLAIAALRSGLARVDNEGHI